MNLQHLDNVALSVSDIERSVRWYEGTLGLRHDSPWGGEPQLMWAGDTAVALFAVSGSGVKMSEGDRRKRLTMRHFAFHVDRANFDRAQQEFREKGIDYEFADHGVCHSVYIEDPDGHTIEITTYEV